MSSTVTASSRYFFVSNSESFSIADNSSLSIGDVDMLFAGWIYLDTTTTQQFIVGKWGGAADEYFCDFVNGANQFRFGAYTPGGTLHTVNSTTFGTPSDDTWYFLEFGYDAAADSMFIAVNRGPRNTVSHIGGIRDSNSTFYFGSNNGSTAFLNGRMQAWNFWKTTIPSTTTLDAIYNAGVGKFYHSLTTDEKVGLISSWDLVETSGTARDAHGTNHLTDNNTVTSAAGKVTYTAEDASQFTAANSEYLSIADASQSGLDVSSAFTLMGWIYLDGTAHNFLFGKWNSTGNNISYNIDRYLGQFRTIGSVNGSTQTINNFNVPSAGTPMWIHVAWSYLSGSGGTFYINGASAGATTNFGDVYNGTAAFTIGRYDGSAVYLSGRASNVAVYNTNLDAAAVLAHYNRGFGLDYSDLTAGQKTNLVSYWELTEASGTRYDSHGSNDLTDNNTVTGNPGVVYDVPTPPAPVSGIKSNKLSIGLRIGI